MANQRNIQAKDLIGLYIKCNILLTMLFVIIIWLQIFNYESYQIGLWFIRLIIIGIPMHFVSVNLLALGFNRDYNTIKQPEQVVAEQPQNDFYDFSKDNRPVEVDQETYYRYHDDWVPDIDDEELNQVVVTEQHVQKGDLDDVTVIDLDVKISEH